MNKIHVRMLVGAFLVMIAGIHNGFAQSSKIAEQASQDFVFCRVLYKNMDGSFWSDELRVATSDLNSLPNLPPEPHKPIGQPFHDHFHEKFTSRVETKAGPMIETYEGYFSDADLEERYVPLGEQVFLKPEICWPPRRWPTGDQGMPEIYTSELPARNLRALWFTRSVHSGGSLPLRYFGVVVQLYERQISVRTATFTGRKTVEKGAWIFKNKTVSDLKEAKISLRDQWKAVSVLPSCAAFK